MQCTRIACLVLLIAAAAAAWNHEDEIAKAEARVEDAIAEQSALVERRMVLEENVTKSFHDREDLRREIKRLEHADAEHHAEEIALAKKRVESITAYLPGLEAEIEALHEKDSELHESISEARHNERVVRGMPDGPVEEEPHVEHVHDRPEYPPMHEDVRTNPDDEAAEDQALNA